MNQPIHTPQAAQANPLAPRQPIYQEIRHQVAIAAGIEAISAQSIDQGEATHDQLEHLGALSAMLRQRLDRLAHRIAEAGA